MSGDPGRLSTYLRREAWTLAAVTVTGILYNVGLAAGPWFEGRLAQMLCDILTGQKERGAMLPLALWYVVVLGAVQGVRFLKRWYVRRFANHINRDMKAALYRDLVRRSPRELEEESVGALMTKALSDVDVYTEGIRKFTTEVFDTGVVMLSYLALLLALDPRLTLLCCLFPPVAGLAAGRLRRQVARAAAESKESAGRLSQATLDRTSNAMLYRVYGLEGARDRAYEEALTDYERRAVRSGVWENAMQPLYQSISMLGVVFLLWFGGKNVLGTGWQSWDIAAFTTFLSCFTRLAAKAAKAAKLFNSVQKAQVSWARIHPFLRPVEEQTEEVPGPGVLEVENLTFRYPGGEPVFAQVTFTARPGEIVGVTGPVACGKSTLGRLFLGDEPYEGHIRLGGAELSRLPPGTAVYLGHRPELLCATVGENILLGDPGDPMEWLRAVCMDREVAAFPQGVDTPVGSDGAGLSGGQQARLALARTLCHQRPILVLDDPFAAVDQQTEEAILANLRALAGDCVVLLLSHRLRCFPQLDQVLWMEEGAVRTSTHAHLMEDCPAYARLYRAQTGEEARHEAE